MRHRRGARLRRLPLPRRTHHHPRIEHTINLDTARDNLCAAADHYNDDDAKHSHLCCAALDYKHVHDDELAHHHHDAAAAALDQLRADAIDAVLTVIASSWRLPAVDRYLTARTARDPLER